jgi:D-sedoheptulose 7-phosphate isomerase
MGSDPITAGKNRSSGVTGLLTLRNQALESLARIPLDDIEGAVQLIRRAADKGQRIWTAGNGGSAATASHLAADLNRWSSEGNGRSIMACCLCDNTALLTSLVNDVGWDAVFEYQLRHNATRGDVFVAISVHGGACRANKAVWSQNLVRAIEVAKQMGCHAIGISGFDGGLFGAHCDINIVVPADSTPLVEGLHGIVTHMIAEELRLRPGRGS